MKGKGCWSHCKVLSKALGEQLGVQDRAGAEMMSTDA